MPEIKRTFTAGKMNKDLDERLVRNGEYRDALNIKVRTTDGDSDGIGNAGVVQNIKGTEIIAEAYKVEEYKVAGVTNPLCTKFVGSVSDEKNDKAYFFAAAPLSEDGFDSILHTHIMTKQVTNEQAALFEFNNPDVIEELDTLTFSPNTLEEHASVMDPVLKYWIDSIIEVDALTETSRPIFVDKFGVTGRWIDVVKSGEENIPNSGFSQLEVTDGNFFRIGMIMYLYNNDGDHLLFGENNEYGVEILDIQEDTLVLATEQNIDLYSEWQAGNINWQSAFKFIHPERVLEFDYNKLIPNINIIDNLLFYTDGVNEPKKINITRSLKGTIIPKLGNSQEDIALVQTATSYLENPKHTKLFVNNTTTDALPEFVIVGDLEWSLKTSDIKKEHITVIRKAPISPPTLVMRDTDRDTLVNFTLEDYNGFTVNGEVSAGQTVVITDDDIPDGIRINDVLRFTSTANPANPIVITARVVSFESGELEIQLTFVDDDLIIQNPTEWQVKIEQERPLFETKFGRVGYRYQYDDNEYSSFSPWSELAFLPGTFLYTPSKGHNVGMVNNVRELIIKDFIPDDSIRPTDVKMVDILWKTTDDQNVYIIKSITRARDREWNVQEDETTGNLVLSSEMIHRVLSNEQLLRSWDNVPKTAKTQEITASRLVFGNYTQGYNIDRVVDLEQTLLSKPLTTQLNPEKSVKSIRNYKFGMVFGDEYGRETPVIARGYNTDVDTGTTGDVSVDKSLSYFANSFKLKQNWETEPEEWMEYIKYYVKETSNEYYNLILDRWYEAEEEVDTVWLAFPSVDRNKLDEETYLILKNEHGSQNAVIEKARYKILAIENEAPDFIKTDYRTFSRIEINYENVFTDTSTSTGIPDLLFDDKKIFTSSDQYGSEFGPQLEDFKGKIRVRIVGVALDGPNGNETSVEYKSPWRTVTRLKTNGDNQGCEVSEIYTSEEVNAYAALVNIVDLSNTSTSIKYFIELQDEVVENKPEFDGRFFVKIERDAVLDEKVLKLQSSSANYIVTKSVKIGYVTNQATNPASLAGGVVTLADADLTFPDIGDWTASNIASVQSDPPAFELRSDVNTGINNDPTAVFDDIPFADIRSSTGSIPKFGPGDSEATQDFWRYWETNKASTIFIDEVPAYSGFNLPFSILQPQIIQNANDAFNTTLTSLPAHFDSKNIYVDANTDLGIPLAISLLFQGRNYAGESWGEDGLQEFTQDFASNTGVVKNWHPAGLSSGSASSTLNQLTFSSVGQKEVGKFGAPTSDEEVFKNRMQLIGQHFRFVNDPNQIVYKTIPLESVDFNGDPVNPASISINSKNYSTSDIDDSLANRSSIIIRFVRLDNNGAEVLENGQPVGIDISQYDPRGTVKHWGETSFTIQLLTPVKEDGLLEDDVVDVKACFETEPKENVDIDIYYEASGAVPMNLKEDNIRAFVSPNIKPSLASKFNVLPRKLIYGGNENVNISQAFVFNTIGKNALAIAQGDDFISTELITIVSGNNALGVAIDDSVSFKHPNGLVTQSKIIDHLKAIDINSDGNFDVTTKSDRFTASPLTYNAGDTLLTFYASLGIPNVGDQVIGNNVENGTFVTAVSNISFPDQTAGVQVSFNKAFQVSQQNASLTFISVTGYYQIDTEIWKYPVELAWFNCYSFGNGIESDRIRDDFNAPTIDNGIKVSSTFLDYKEETIGSGLIHSSELYNATSSVNGLNEFSMAQKITKNLNPVYGSIQALKTRDTNLVTFCEDKILKVLANKDAVFNADGNPQLTATNRVLGQTIPFAGDYGISKNPESLTVDQYRMYFTDKQRGAVLRLSGDGLTPISNVGMKSWFRENLIDSENIIGTFDLENGEYNVTLDYTEVSQKSPITVSFNEGSKGWVSFKSFIPNCGTSISGKYLTAPSGTHVRVTHKVYKHNASEIRNSFYESTNFKSEIEVTFNDLPNVVKSFKAISYEGTQGKVLESTNLTTPTFPDALLNFVSTDDNEFYNLSEKLGWFVESINTDINSGRVPEFRKKEGKWFNRIFGSETSFIPDGEEIFVQGIGFPVLIGATPSSDTETQTEADIEIEAQTLELNNSSVVFTILFDPLFETYAIQINSVNNITNTSEFLEIYNFELEQNLQDGGDLIPISTNDPFTSNLTAGFYAMTVTEINDINNSIQFPITISENTNYDNINS